MKGPKSITLRLTTKSKLLSTLDYQSVSCAWTKQKKKYLFDP